MPRKKNPVLSESASEEISAEKTVLSILEERVFQPAWLGARTRLIQRIANVQAAEKVMEAVLSVVSLESLDAKPPSLSNPNKEPNPMLADTWAGMIPVRRVKMPTKIGGLPIFTDRPPSKDSSTQRSLRSNRKPGKKRKGSEIETIQSPVAVVESLAEPELKTPSDNENDLRANLKKKGEPTGKEEVVRNDDKSKDAKINLQGKSYTFNHKGEIIFTKSVKIEALPGTKVKSGVILMSRPTSPKDDEPKDKKKTKKRRSIKGEETVVHKKATVPVQPPLDTTMKIQPGITLRTRTTQLQGEERSRYEAQAMTLTEYNDFLDHAEQKHEMAPVESSPQEVEQIEVEETLAGAETINAVSEKTVGIDAVTVMTTHGMSKSNTDVFNASIMADTNWGNNPPEAKPASPTKLPKDHSQKEFEHRIKRDYRSNVERLPPPEVGMSMGHDNLVRSPKSKPDKPIRKPQGEVKEYEYEREFKIRKKEEKMFATKASKTFLRDLVT